MLKKLRAIFLFLAGLQLAWAMPAAAQNAQHVQINVRVSNAETNEPLYGFDVIYNESASACNQQHGSQAMLPTRRTGEVTFGTNIFVVCPGPSLITVNGGDDFVSQRQEIEIVPGKVVYNVFIKLEPKGRVVNIRVQGRLANGSLVPVHFAMVYDRNGNHVATTDYEGIGTARVREVVGETVTLRAGGSHWRSASSSYIVGAYHSGSKLTRSQDYVNFVLNSEEEGAKQEIALQINVQGAKSGHRVPIEHALIYDENGHYLTSTDSRGHAAAVVEQAFGETFRLKAEAQHWSSQTLSLLARSETRNAYAGPPGSKYLYQQVRFLLEPNANGVGDLVIEVLDRDTDRPVPAAAVRLYKPTGFPGTLVGVETTNHNGEVTFDNRHVERALTGDEARVGVTHGGYLDAIQTVAGSLTAAELPRYIVYLHPKKENTKWSGTWVEGPYTMQVSGGTGSLGYSSLRSEGVGTCCPLVDQGGGHCNVIGNKAICQYNGHYHDDAKDVTYGGHGTLTLSGDSIQYKFTQVTGAITLSSGQPCPDIAQCTGLHPGATFTGSWARKKQ